MYSDDENNSADELNPRTSLRPTPAPFSHAPFQSAVPDVSLVFNNTRKQPTISSSEVVSKPASEGFESYNAWRHSNLKSVDESSLRFKYYSTSPRYSNEVTPVKTSVEPSDDSPRMAPLQPNYQLPHNNPSNQRQPSNSPLDKRYDSQEINREPRQDENIAPNFNSQAYRNSTTFGEGFYTSPTNSQPSVRSSPQSYERICQPSQPQRFSEHYQPNQTFSPNHRVPLNGNFEPTQFGYQTPANLHHRDNQVGLEMRGCNRQATNERHFVDDRLSRSVQVHDPGRFVCAQSCHCLAEPSRNMRGAEQEISVADLYRLIQLQNQEIHGLRSQVQGLLDQNNRQRTQEIHLAVHEQGPADSNCQTGNTTTQLVVQERNDNVAGGRNLQNGNNEGRIVERNQTVIACESTAATSPGQAKQQVTKQQAANKQQAVNNKQQAGSNKKKAVRANRTESNRAVVQQVSIGVMTSFVDQNYQFYQSQQTEPRPARSNALLRQATATSAAAKTPPTESHTWARLAAGRQEGRTPPDQTHAPPAREDSLTLHDVDISEPREATHSPDPTLHLDLRDFPSSSGSASGSEGGSSQEEEQPPRVGWTFYRDMVGQVNEMLHSERTQTQQHADSCHGQPANNNHPQPQQHRHNERPTRDVAPDDRHGYHADNRHRGYQRNPEYRSNQREFPGTTTGGTGTWQEPGQTCDVNAVRNATVEQLHKLGVSFCENNTNSALAAAKKVTFDSVYYQPYAPTYQAGYPDNRPSDVSMRMDALAVKYLRQAPHLQDSGGSLGYELPARVCNVSMATMRYLERYRLLPGAAPSQPRAAPIAEQPAQFPRQEPIRDQFHPPRNDFHPIRDLHQGMYDQQTVPPHKILDITALKEQPKFI